MRAIPFSQLPGMNALFLDFIDSPAKVADLYPDSSKVPSRDVPHRKQLCAILKRQNHQFGNDAATELIDKLEDTATRCIITGQQVGLLTGPLYTIWKALSAIQLAKSTEQNGNPCIPMFWMATEDHNWHEISNFGLLKEDLELVTTSLKDHLFVKRQPTGSVPVDHPEMRKILLRIFPHIPNPQVKEDYSSGDLKTAFARSLLRLLRDFPIVLIDPSDPELKRLAAPFFDQFFRKSEALLSTLTEQNGKLRNRNYPVQVQTEEENLPLFVIEGEDRVHLKKGGVAHDIPPEKLSPSALLRPLFQDYLFPTIAYVAGPGEIAYFAQLKPWYSEFGMEQPWLHPRVSLTLLPHPTRSFLEAFDLTPEELYLKEDTIVEAVLDQETWNQAKKEIRDLQLTMQRSIHRLRTIAQQIDGTLTKSIDTTEKKLLYQMQKAERKFLLALKRKNLQFSDRLRKAKNVVFPTEKLQERYLNIFSFSSRLPDLILEVFQKIDWNLKQHQQIEI